MMVYGIYGKIGSGKKKITSFLSNEYNIINLDDIVQKCIIDNEDCRMLINDLYGESSYIYDKEKNRYIDNFNINSLDELMFIFSTISNIVYNALLTEMLEKKNGMDYLVITSYIKAYSNENFKFDKIIKIETSSTAISRRLNAPEKEIELFSEVNNDDYYPTLGNNNDIKIDSDFLPKVNALRTLIKC